LLTCAAVYAFLGSVVAVLLYRHVVSVPMGAGDGSAPPDAPPLASAAKPAKVAAR
jgi:hypothetical protein